MPPFSAKMRPNSQREKTSRRHEIPDDLSDLSDDVFESLSEVEQTPSKKSTKSTRKTTGAKPTRRSVRARAQSTATESESSEYDSEENEDDDDDDEEDEEDDDTADERVPSRSLKKKGHRTGLSNDFKGKVEILSDFEDDSSSDEAAMQAFFDNEMLAQQGGDFAGIASNDEDQAAEFGYAPTFVDDDNYDDVENLSDGSATDSDEAEDAEEIAILNDESSDALEGGALDSFVEQTQRRSVRFQTPSSSSSSSATMNDHDIFIPDRNMFPDLDTDLSQLQPFPITNSYFAEEPRPSQSSAEEEVEAYEDFGSDGDTTDSEYYHPPAAIQLGELMRDAKDTKSKSRTATNIKLSSYKPITPKGEKRKMPMIGTWDPEPTKPVVFIASNTPSKSSVVVQPARTPQASSQKLLPPFPPDFYSANFLDAHQSSDADFIALQEQVGAEYSSADDEMLAKFFQTFDSSDSDEQISEHEHEHEHDSDSEPDEDEVTGVASVSVDVDDDNEKAETETTQVLDSSLKHLQRLDMLRATAFRNNQMHVMEKSKGSMHAASGFAPGKFGAAHETISPLAKRKKRRTERDEGRNRKRVAVGI